MPHLSYVLQSDDFLQGKLLQNLNICGYVRIKFQLTEKSTESERCEDKVLLLLSKYIYLLLQNKDPGQSVFELWNHVNEKLMNEKGF